MIRSSSDNDKNQRDTECPIDIARVTVNAHPQYYKIGSLLEHMVNSGNRFAKLDSAYKALNTKYAKKWKRWFHNVYSYQVLFGTQILGLLLFLAVLFWMHLRFKEHAEIQLENAMKPSKEDNNAKFFNWSGVRESKGYFELYIYIVIMLSVPLLKIPQENEINESRPFMNYFFPALNIDPNHTIVTNNNPVNYVDSSKLIEVDWPIVSPGDGITQRELDSLLRERLQIIDSNFDAITRSNGRWRNGDPIFNKSSKP